MLQKIKDFLNPTKKPLKKLAALVVLLAAGYILRAEHIIYTLERVSSFDSTSSSSSAANLILDNAYNEAIGQQLEEWNHLNFELACSIRNLISLNSRNPSPQLQSDLSTISEEFSLLPPPESIDYQNIVSLRRFVKLVKDIVTFHNGK